jgi:hypothetical protein
MERNFSDDYILMEMLGTGSYSVCKLARHKATGQQFAVKVSTWKPSKFLSYKFQRARHFRS